MPDPEPAAPTRTLVRPRVGSVVVYACIALVGVGLVSTGRGAGLALGAFMLAVAGFCFVSAATTRVVVEGDLLHVRAPLRSRDPVRLDRLVDAGLTGWSMGKGPELELVDADGARVLLDATNFRLGGLYAELATRIEASDRSAGADRRVADDRVHHRLDLHRDRS